VAVAQSNVKQEYSDSASAESVDKAALLKHVVARYKIPVVEQVPGPRHSCSAFDSPAPFVCLARVVRFRFRV
jgi:hypothetical protein